MQYLVFKHALILKEKIPLYTPKKVGLMLSLYDLVLAAHKGEEEKILVLIDQFKPLLKKYAHKLYYEFDDAYSDMLLAFISLIHNSAIVNVSSKNDGYVVNYIENSMYHAFCQLYNKHANYMESPLDISGKEDSEEAYTANWDTLCCEEDSVEWEIFDSLYTYLSFRDAEIIKYLFKDKYSVQELAKKYGVAPSIISRAKSRALSKLRKFAENTLFSNNKFSGHDTKENRNVQAK